MELTPLDIHHKEFHRAIRGYNEEEVDVFLDQVADAFEHLFNENRELKEQTDKMKDKVLKYEGLEQTMQKAILTAQQAADEVQSSAAKESELIVKDAELKAREIIQGIDDQKRKIQEQLEGLKGTEEDFRENFKSLLKEYLGTIKNIETGEIEFEEQEPVVAAEKKVEEPGEEAAIETEETKPEPDQVEKRAEETRVEFSEEAQLEKDMRVEEEQEYTAQVTEERTPATDTVSTEEIYQRETEISEEEPTVFIPPPGSSDQVPEHGESESQSRPVDAGKEAREGDAEERKESATTFDETKKEEGEESGKKGQDPENFFDNSTFFDASENDKKEDNDSGERQRQSSSDDDKIDSKGNEGPSNSENDFLNESDDESSQSKQEDNVTTPNEIDYGFPEPGRNKPTGTTDDVNTFFDDNLGSE